MEINKAEITKIFDTLKNEYHLDIIFITAIDIEEGYNTFFVVDRAAKHLVEKSLEFTFTGDIAVNNKVVMRKTIVPLLKQFCEENK